MFTPNSFIDGSAGNTPITAATLNNLETGLVAADITNPASAAAVALAAGYAPQAGGFNFSGPFTSMYDLVSGAGFIMKPTSDVRQGTIGWQHASPAGYLLHFESRSGGASPAAMIGIGLDFAGPSSTLGVAGILISNKIGAQGMIISNGPLNTNTSGFGFYGTQESPNAPLMTLRSRAGGVGALLELKVESGTPVAGDKLATFVIAANGLAGDIASDTGLFRWIMGASLRDTQVNTTLTLRNDTGTGNPAKLVLTDPATYAGIIEAGVTPGSTADVSTAWFRPTGAGTFWANRIVTSSNQLNIQTSGAAAKGSESWSSVISLQNNALGFFGAAPVARPTSTPAAATDLPTVVALANSIRASLVALGLVS